MFQDLGVGVEGVAFQRCAFNHHQVPSPCANPKALNPQPSRRGTHLPGRSQETGASCCDPKQRFLKIRWGFSENRGS